MILDSYSLSNNAQALNMAMAVVREELNSRAYRKEDYQYNWDVYNGYHQQYFKRRLDESDELYAYRKDNAVVNNLCAFTVDLSSKYLYGKASKVVRRFSKKDETDKKVIDLVFDKFDIDSFLLDASKQTSVFGETLVRLIPVDSETKKQVSGVSTKTSYPHPIQLDPRTTFVSRNLYGKIEAVVLFYYSADYGSGQAITVMELITDDVRWIWKSEGTMSFNFPKALALSFAGVPFFTKNVEGSHEVNYVPVQDEFVYFVNADTRKSDLSAIADLNITLDEALTDKKHFFQRHGWPQMVTSVDLRNVEKSPNKIWEIAQDFADDQKVADKFGFLTWDGKQDQQQIYVDNLERMIMILSNTAAISTGDLKAIGQLRSGAALITAHSVAIHKTEAKQIVWSRNEKALYRALINYDSYLHGEVADTRYPDFSVWIRFPKDFVPGAEAERVNIQNTQFAGHLKPLNDLLLEEYGSLTQEELDEKRKQIIADSIEVIDSARLFESVQAGGDASGGASKPALRTSQVKSKEQSAPTK